MRRITQTMLTLGRRLKKLREDRGLSQEQVAEIFNVSRGSISSWEMGRREPDLETIKKIADFYGVTVDYLTGRGKHANIDDPLLDKFYVRVPKMTPAMRRNIESLLDMLDEMDKPTSK